MGAIGYVVKLSMSRRLQCLIFRNLFTVSAFFHNYEGFLCLMLTILAYLVHIPVNNILVGGA